MLKARHFIFLIIMAAMVFVAITTWINLQDEELTNPVKAVRNPSENPIEVTSVPVEETAVSVENFPGPSVAGNVDSAPDEKLGQDSVIDRAGPDPERSGEQGAALLSKPAQKAVTLPNAGGHLPLMIRWSNWQPEYGPAIVYARERDLGGMLRMQGPVKKMLLVTSFSEVERLMANAEDLHAAGVTIVGLNTENGPGMTPPSEMDTLNSPDPEVNMVARSAKLADQYGFNLVWGPVRDTADLVDDDAITTMMASGMRGIALQEQKFIEVQPARLRLAEVNRTRERYLRLAQKQALDDFTFHVQIMPQRCPDLSNCVAFVLGLEDIPVDSIAIWSNGPIPLGFISAIRHY